MLMQIADMVRRPLWLKIGAAIATLLFVSGCRDCIYSAKVSAWLDANQNGIRDAGELPLEGILFHVDDIHNGFRKVGNAVSTHAGDARVAVWMPGCPTVTLEVYSDAPDEYRLTTAERFRADLSQPDAEFSFGYLYTPMHAPTPVPLPDPLACQSMPIPYFRSYWLPIAFTESGVGWTASESHESRLIEMIPINHAVREHQRGEDFLGFADVYDMAIAPDGAVWLTTYSGVSRFDKGAWNSFIQDNGMHAGNAQDIAILPTGDVIVETAAGLEVLDPPTISWYVLMPPEALGNRDQNRFRKIGNEAWLISSDQILRFWKDESSSKVQSEVLLTKDTVGELTVAGISDAGLAPDGALWVAGYDDQQRSFVARAMDDSLDTWTTHSYRTTGGAIGRSGIGGLEISLDGSIWLDEGAFLVHGTAISSDGTTFRWDRYDAASLMQMNETQVISRIAAAPDGSIWLGQIDSWYRCIQGTP